MWKLTTAVAFATALQFSAPCEAASLRVAPVILDLSGATATSNVRIWNDGSKPVNVQIRVFRWRQEDGKDIYLPADAVVVSPPMTTLKPGAENIVRVVRTTKKNPLSEESYRLIVDELPPSGGRKAGVVMLVVRQSIPVFFAPTNISDAAPTWRVRVVKGGYEVSVGNSGGKRLKVSNLTLSDGRNVIARHDGLVGYVLGQSDARWFVPSAGNDRRGSAINVKAQSEAGPLDATARLTKS